MSNLEMTVEALKRCVDPEVFAKAMWEVSEGTKKRSVFLEPSQTREVAPNIEKEIRKLLTELGMPPHIKGHRCAMVAIRALIEEPDYLYSIMKELYPAVAELCDTTPSRAERAIRHGVECVWDRGDLDVLNCHFGNTVSIHKGKPTNSEFLATCAAIVRERMQETNN